MKHPGVINIDQLEFESRSNGEHFQSDNAPVANRIGAEQLGYRITRVPAGKRAWPLHAHYANEEMFFVLEGSGIVRFGEQSVPIRQHDFIAAPANPETPHQIVNTSAVDLVYLCVSTMLQPDVTLYPESDKIGVIAGAAPGRTVAGQGITKFFKANTHVNYWQDEE